jgi:hypothetical protein
MVSGSVIMFIMPRIIPIAAPAMLSVPHGAAWVI